MSVILACSSGRHSSSRNRSPATPDTAGTAGQAIAAAGAAPSHAGTSGTSNATPLPQSGSAGVSSTPIPDSAGTSGAGGVSNDAPVSTRCGDGIRDPVLEECDDGTDDEDDSCTDDCRIRTVLVVSEEPKSVEDAPLPQHFRTFDYGRHPVAAGDKRIAVAYRERELGVTRVMAQLFDAQGRRDGEPIEASQGVTALDSAEPVVAELPGDRFAVVWAQSSGEDLDIVIQVIGLDLDVLPPPMTANENLFGAQHDPDVLWTGSSLMVAWSDEIGLKIRRFTAGPGPIEPEQILAEAESIEGNVALTRYEGSWAAAWRSDDGFETVRVRAGETEWSLGTFMPGPTGDHPALIELDADHLLVVFTELTAPEGVPNIGRLRYAVLDVDKPGQTDYLPVGARVEPFASDDSLDQRRPSLARAGDHLFLAWESTNHSDEAYWKDVWLAELDWSVDDSGTGKLVWHEEVPLPIRIDLSHNQQSPSLAGSDLGPGGALAAVWEDASGHEPGLPNPNIAFVLRPVPLVTLPATGESEEP